MRWVLLLVLALAGCGGAAKPSSSGTTDTSFHSGLQADGSVAFERSQP
jgi:hypothetical protein